MLRKTQILRPNSLIPPYPNYHKGDYFEEFFYKKFITEYSDLQINEFKYIPIFWTNCYTNKVFAKSDYNIQEILNNLDENQKYFTISQHDDCVYENLPKNTIVFSMGGNKKGENIIPIPLICSPIPKIKNDKKHKISFVGSLTHPIRTQIYNHFKNNTDFIFFVKNWELNSEKLDIERFIDTTSKSEFTLCPRGYGATSFRLYESMQLDSIPIYVYDTPWLPWNDEIDWSKLSILVESKDIPNIKNMTDEIDFKSMIKYKNEIFSNYFTYNGVYIKIIEKLKNGNFKI
jgi:hypothetical protein